jgi:trans-aconitate methyltransferase
VSASNVDTALILLELLQPQTGELILDAGCGIGTASALLAERGASVIGVDSLGVLLEQARLTAPDVTFIEADLTEWEPPRPLDAIFASSVLSWIHPPDVMAKRFFGWLKPGGRLAATLGGANESARQLESYYEPAQKEFRRVLQRAGFEVDLIEKELGCLFVLAWRPEPAARRGLGAIFGSKP